MAVGFELCGDLSAKTVVGLRSEIALLLAEPARALFRKGAAPNFDQSPSQLRVLRAVTPRLAAVFMESVETSLQVSAGVHHEISFFGIQSRSVKSASITKRL